MVRDALRRVDGRIVEAIQEAYLWIFDRTGVYLGTMIFAAMAADMICYRATDYIRLTDVLWLGAQSILPISRYWLQGRDLKLLNAAHLDWRHSTMRLVIVTTMIPLIIMHIVQLEAWKVASAALFLSWLYLLCVMLRDREPKDFFAQRKLAGSRT